MNEIETRRLTASDRMLARKLFIMMAEVFEEPREPLGDSYLERLLGREDFWVLAAMVGGEVVGGLTAHTLPMSRTESSELFLYDLAVRQDQQRKGVGRKLVAALRTLGAQSGIEDVFVAADNADDHALDFYRALGGVAAPVTMFSFSGEAP